MISIVVPTFNELGSGFLKPILESLSKLKDVEIIVVDGGSTDGTLKLLEGFSVRLFSLEKSTRAARLNKGIASSRGELILLHHPRSLVSAEAVVSLQAAARGRQNYWGGFTHQFDMTHPLLRFTSWYSNKIRCDLRGIVYLDHCIFFDGSIRDRGFMVPDVEIFEDTEISKILRALSHPIRLAAPARTSAVRFRNNGLYRQSLMNQLLKLGYALKVPAKTMNRLYEKGLGLNS
jgi:glycosyltransferase involved in cell wall biosynthesis